MKKIIEYDFGRFPLSPLDSFNELTLDAAIEEEQEESKDEFEFREENYTQDKILRDV